MHSVNAVLKNLIKRGTITEEQAREADSTSLSMPSERDGKKKNALDLLVDEQTITERDILSSIEQHYKVPLINDPLTITPDILALEKMPEEDAHSLEAVPLSYDKKKGVLSVAIIPRKVGDLNFQDDVKRVTGVSRIEFNMISQENLTVAWQRVYRAEASIGRMAKDLQASEQKKSGTSTKDDTPEVADEESEIQKLVTMLLRQAISDGASDVHLEPSGDSLRFRQRVDGVLRDIKMQVDNKLVKKISSVVKIMAKIDLSRKQETHDGRLTIDDRYGNSVDLRVSVIPSIHGESIVMRIADNSLAQLELEKLGFSPRNYERFMTAMSKPYGMILVTGPTGSGKSTTLYAALNKITTPEKKVITVEDPVEYRIDGITQIEVQPPRPGVPSKLDFPNVLRAILRHDPDVILVGEVRDLTTAQISMDAAMTGHLVLSTLHTNSAAAAVTRLKEMGVEPYLVSGVAEGVLAQRLVRRLCRCKQAYQPTTTELISSGYWEEDQGISIQLYRPNPAGCLQCGQSGYKGRVAVHEVLIIDDEIENMIVSGANTTDIEHAAQKTGMHTLRQDGWEKVSDGVTSIEEILRVIA